MCKSIRETHQPKQVPTDAAEELEKETTRSRTSRKRPPKCADLVVANGIHVISYENRTTGGFFEKKTEHIYSKEDNLLHAISKLRYVLFHVVVVPRSVFLPQEIRKLVRWSLTRG